LINRPRGVAEAQQVSLGLVNLSLRYEF